MASESLSRGVDLFFAQEFCFIKQEHGPSRGSKQAKIGVLLMTVLGPLRWQVGRKRTGTPSLHADTHCSLELSLACIPTPTRRKKFHFSSARCGST